MEKTLEEMLQDLQCFKIDSLDLCALEGNKLGRSYWRITYAQTIGGEKFKFTQPDWLGNDGSGIYFDTISEAIWYARSRVKELFEKEKRGSSLIKDASAYDWRAHGGLAEV